MKKRYRSRIQIFEDIFETIKEDNGRTGKTRILYGANLSHDRLTKYLQKLIEQDIIKVIKEEGRDTYAITKKGYAFLKELKKIKEFAQAFGIKI